MSIFPRWLKSTLVLAAVILLAGIAWYYRSQRLHRLNDVNANLEAIAQLKIKWIGEWRRARLGEAAAMMGSRLYTSLAARWMEGPPAAADVEAVMSGLRASQQLYQYHDALFVSAAGKIYFRLNAQPGDLHEVSRKALAEAFRTHKPVLADLYIAPGENHPQVDVALPFFVRTGDSSMPSGALLWQYNAEEFLYPIIQFWPVPSRTAETLLVRRDGDSALYLNELRHQEGTALTLRIPLSREEVIAVMAVSGQRGALRGKDYRGAEVLSAVKSVPDSTWVMVAKEDEDEAFSELRRESLLILAMLLFLITSVSTALGVIWQRNEKAHYRILFEAEAAQRKSEEHYRNTLDSMMEGFHIIDFEWRYIYLNAASIRHCRRSKEELLGRTVMESFPGIETTNAFFALQRCMNERIPQLAQGEFNYPDGTKGWFEFSIQAVPEGISVLTIDTSERRLAEESLREAEARYRALFEHMTQGAFRQQADGKIVDVNPAALVMFGLTRDKFLNRTSESPEWGVIHEDNSPFPGMEHPSMVALRTGKAVSAVAGVFNPQRQSRVWMEISAIPEFLEGDNKPYQVLVTLHDITDRKQAQVEHDRLASAIEQSGEVVVIIDPKGVIQYANPAFEAVTGFNREEAIGKRLPTLIADSQDEAFHRKFWDTLESGKIWRGRIVNRRKDGTLYTDYATVSPVFNSSGAIVNYVSVTRDITEYLKLQSEKEKLQEQFLQAQKMESVGRLAGGIAHDFNNMLSVISGHAQLSLDKLDTTDPLYAHLQEINYAALRSADLTRQLLAFARKQTVAPKVLNLNNTIGGLLSMLQRLVGEDIDIAWMPGHGLWPVRIDPAQVDQILANLAVNARDAIDKHGQVVMETDNVALDESYCADHPGFIPGEYIMLALSDDGCGMDKDVLDHIFEPFFTTKRVGKGTGLGLATVYGIVKQNNGFINIYSEPGKGSTFKIYLPRYCGPETTGKAEAQAEPLKGGAETILLVEDEVAVLNLAKLMLKRLGYKVITATTPSEALSLTGSYAGEIHLLLVDVVMPEMTGHELSEQLISLRPNLKRLYMSGYTANVIAHHGVLNEGVHFVQKPFSARSLAEKVREALEN